MPGVLIVEAMAQTAGVMMLASIPDRESKLVFFTGIDNARFRRPVVPGDQLRLELTVLRLRPRYIRLRGEAYVDGQLVAEAEISSSLVDRSVVGRGDEINSAGFTPVEPS
jgi:3-hydroxymyristoyl/3-hydroxydecanoyl-(acyl carrier protein) dehydratase